jgi:hypothetical protein
MIDFDWDEIVSFATDLRIAQGVATGDTHAMNRAPIDELIDALVWMRRISRSKRIKRLRSKRKRIPRRSAKPVQSS